MSATFLYTVPQWIVFAALFMVIYGWVEHKKTFRLIGLFIFMLLGILSILIIFGDYLNAGDYLSPAEVAAEELDDEIINEIPIEPQLLPAYWSFVVAAVMSIPTIFLDWKNHKRAKLFIVLTSLITLAGFFMVVGTIRGM